MNDKEFENKVRDLYATCVVEYKGAHGFMERLREIMPPTCGKEQRLFLNEIAELYEYNDHLEFPHLQRKRITKFSNIYQDDFNANLQKVIKGE